MMEVTVPSHLGLILDGNRRWANNNNLPTLEGHRRGSEVLRDRTLDLINSGVEYVSAYVFSAENWKRTEEEVKYLMSLVASVVEEYLELFHKEGIKIIVLGRRHGLRSKVVKAIEKAEKRTVDNARGVLALCLNYSGQEEIIDSIKNIIRLGVPVDEITSEKISKNLYHPELPEIDMIIRTSGEQRLSGFMTWRSQYAELFFSDKLWPDFSSNDVEEALAWFSERSRRFGQ